jgi:DNA-binding response OmpR family regulator
MKIVLIDDDPLVLLTLGNMFRRKGHAVLTYDNPMECPVCKAEHPSCFPDSTCPDIIITDYDMPGMNGMKFIETIINKGCQCRNIAVLSGKMIPDADMKRFAEFGTRSFTKPLDYAEFEAWLTLRERSTR